MPANAALRFFTKSIFQSFFILSIILIRCFQQQAVSQTVYSGYLDTTFYYKTLNALITTTAIQSDGKILMGGTVTSYDGVTVGRFTRLNADGTLDTAFNTNLGTGFNNTVWSILVQADGDILVGGAFTSFNGTAVKYVVRLNSDGTLDTSFNCKINTGSVNTLALDGNGKLLVGGSFEGYDGATKYNATDWIQNVIRLNNDGSLDNTFVPPGLGFRAEIKKIIVQPDGKLLFIGSFIDYNLVNISDRIARLNSDATLDTSFNPSGAGFTSTASSMDLDPDGNILVSGNGGSYNGVTLNSFWVVRLSSTGTMDSGFTPSFNTFVDVVNVQADGKILVGGIFTTVNGVTDSGLTWYLVRLLTDGTLDSDFKKQVNTLTRSRAISIQSDSKIVVGGTDMIKRLINTIIAPPSAPTGLLATAGNGQIEISFTPAGSGSSAITNYEYQLDGGAWVAFSPAVTTSPVTISGLTNGTSYSIKLRAVNSVGAGTASAAVSSTPVDLSTLGCITIVASGGDAENSTWKYANGVILPTSATNVNLNASDVLAKLALGNLSVNGSCITVDANVSYTTNTKNIKFKATGNIFVSDSKSIVTNGGDIVFWADSDGDQAGGIRVDDNVQLDSRTQTDRTASTNTTGGGRIVLAGGLDDAGVASGSGSLLSGLVAGDGYPDGYAVNSGSPATQTGIVLGTSTSGTGHNSNISIFSGGGDIHFHGLVTNNTSSPTNGPTGLLFYHGYNINAGTNGDVVLLGRAALTSGQWAAGMDLAAWREAAYNANGTVRTHNGNITLVGRGSGAPSGNWGVMVDGTGTKRNIFAATGTGKITVNGLGSGPSTLDVRMTNVDLLAASGDITIQAEGTAGITIAGYNIGDGLFIGQKAGSLVTSSTSNVIFKTNALTTVNKPIAYNTSGSMIIEPFGNSFGSALSLSNVQIANTISGLTVGKSTNTSKVTMGSAATINGPVSVYGGFINVTAPITAAGDILLDGDTGGFLSQNEIGVLVGAAVKTTNNANITILGRGGSVTNNYGRYGVNVTNLLEAGGTGNINITGYGGLSVGVNLVDGSNHGINIEGANSWVKSNGGNITLAGYGGGVNGGTYNQGVALVTGKLSAGGTGTISITGTGGVNTVVGLRGVVLVDNSSVYSDGGSITITGYPGTNGSDNSDGVTIFNSTIGSASSGPITLSGTAGGGTGSEAITFVGTNTIGATGYSGNLIFRGNSFSNTNATTLSTTGKVTFESEGNSYTSAFSIPSSFLIGTDITGLTVGKSTNTANITLGATTTIAGPITVYGGNISIGENLNTSSGNANGDVFLKATGNISLAASKSITTNGGDVVFWSDSDASGNDNTAGGTISLLASSAISTSNGKIVLAGGADDGSNGGTASDGIPDGYAIGAFVNNPARGATNARTGLFLDGANVDAGSGAIILRGQGTGAAAQGSGLNFQMGTRLYKSTIKGADIRVEGKGSKFTPGNNSSSNWGLSFEGSSIEGSGNIALFGWGGRAGAGNEDVGHAGVEIRSTLDSPTTPSQIKATGSGTISINGVGGSGAFAFPSYGLGADGIRIQSGQANPILSADGNITLNGTSGYNGRGAGINILSPISSTNGNIRLNGFASIEGTVGINGNVIINGKVSTSGDVYVESPGTVSQTAEILADGLGLFGTGTFTLTNVSNNVVTIAGGNDTTKLGSLSFVDASGGLEIGSVNPTGITATGPVSIVTSTGNLSIGANVSTTDASADAIVINAGQSKSPGDGTGGNILVPGAYTVTAGSGGIIKLFSGTKSGSVGITQLVTDSNQQVDVDEMSTFSPALTAGNTYALFRYQQKEYIYSETGLFESLTLNVPHTVKFGPNNTLTMKRTSNVGAGITIDVDCNDFSSTSISNPDHIFGKHSLFDIEYNSAQGMDGTVNYEFEFSDKLPTTGYMIFVDVDAKESIKIKAYKANGDHIPYSDFTMARENGKSPTGSTYTNTVFEDLGSTYSGHLTTLDQPDATDPVVTLQCTQEIKKVVFEFNQNAANEVNESKSMSFGFVQLHKSRTIYVNPVASGANDGTSWSNAYTSLQTGLENAFAGDEVWVAKGTYKPTSSHFLPNTTRNYHFRLPAEVAIYGGFAGTETSVAQRTKFGYGEENASILSGDLSGNDDYTVTPWTGTSENAYHVVYGPDEEICVLTDATILDGFSFVGGNANGTGTDSNNDGGGLVLRDNSPYLSNVDFRNNQCLDKGGAVYLVDCNSRIDNITIRNNENMGDDGGGLAINSGDPVITNALIVNNKAKVDGGGLYLDDATPVITNATIANNRADDDGGGIFITATTANTDTLYLRNSILWGNTAGDSRNQMSRSNSQAMFNYVSYSNSTNDITSGLATGSANNLTTDPMFINASAMDYRLKAISDAVDSGNDSYNTQSTDIRRGAFGRKRSKYDETQTGTIDRGAYEYNEASEDSDGDGIPDGVENEGCSGPAYCDTDGDGIVDIIDSDSDGDGLPDAFEDKVCTGVLPCAPTDSDNDGIPDFQDLDSDGDGIADGDENSDCTGTLPCTPTDTDGDGTPDYLDADTDGDGIPDAVEDSFCEDMMTLGTLSLVEATTTTSTCDSDGDGTPDFRDLDSDGDGIPDAVEDKVCTGSGTCTPTDSDNDGTPDYLDVDSDGDGIPDSLEDSACTGSGTCTPTDTDNDGTPNHLDADSDGDGIPDAVEDSACMGTLPCTPTDTDNDGTPNFLDTDSDGDGIPDSVEDIACTGALPCAPTDTDNDGTPDYLDADSDGDGIPDATENSICASFPDMHVITVNVLGGVTTTCDTDGDGTPNFLDTDSDGDGIPDSVEDIACTGALPCAPTDTDNDGTPNFLDTDSDGDGIPDSVEDTACTGALPCTPTDTDNDGTPNYLDADSDGDGIPDSVEDTACTGTLPCTPTDTDNDGTPDYLDTDSDGDGIPDSVEDTACTDGLPCTPTDTDNDGTPDYLDPDSDGDGIPDEVENDACQLPAIVQMIGAQATINGQLPCDTDNDGIPNFLDTDSDGDGIHDDAEDSACTGTSPCAPTDTDNDGIPNYLDPDADGDNIPDEVENGICGSFPNMPVITIQVVGGTTSTCDTDGDGTPNFLDEDSDGDGLSDDDEETNCSGVLPCVPNDKDNDGLPDFLEGCTNPEDGGSISGDQYICEGMVPAMITGESLPTGQTGELEYKWQVSPTGGGTGFVDIANSNSEDYQPGALVQSRWYRRLSRVSCEESWSEAPSTNESAVIVQKPSGQYLVIETLQQPKCTPPTACKVTIKGLPMATWRMEQNGPVDGYIDGTGNPAIIENLPDGVYQFKVATPAGCFQTPPFGVIIITY